MPWTVAFCSGERERAAWAPEADRHSLFEGAEQPTNRPGISSMIEVAGPDTPLRAFFVPRTTHFSVLAPITALVARKILADNRPTCAISFTAEEIEAAVP